VALLKGEENRLRVRGDEEVKSAQPSYVSASAAKPWSAAVPVRFPLIPASTVATAERFLLTLEAHTPAGMFQEEFRYEWVRELPRKLEADLHRQVSRANFRGTRSGKADLRGAAKAPAAAPSEPPKTAAESKVAIKELRYAPKPLLAMKEAAFEVAVENSPRVPSYSWYFGENPGSKQADSWTAAPRCTFTYSKAGTYTVTVKVRDKNRYAAGDLAVGSWQVAVEPAP
jgi:hypothetical protein